MTNVNRRDVTLDDLVPGAVIYHKERGCRKVIQEVFKNCVYYKFGGYDYIHHPSHGVLVNYEIDKATKVRRPVTREDLKRGRGLVMYHIATDVSKTVFNVDEIRVEYTDGSTIPIDGEYGVLESYEVEVSTSNHVVNVDVDFRVNGEPVNLITPESDEVVQLIESRGSSTYAQISNDASKIIDTLGTGDDFAYFYSQIANKLARIKHGYNVEDSLLDIAGYAKLELEKLRGCE